MWQIGRVWPEQILTLAASFERDPAGLAEAGVLGFGDADISVMVCCCVCTPFGWVASFPFVVSLGVSQRKKKHKQVNNESTKILT